MMQEHQMEALDSCVDGLQQQACAQRLELEDDHHGYFESKRTMSTTRRVIYEGKRRFERLRYGIFTRWEK